MAAPFGALALAPSVVPALCVVLSLMIESSLIRSVLSRSGTAVRDVRNGMINTMILVVLVPA
eukprot:COSAG02_NODE_2962_length_7648_cov_6.176977_1_plen_62_part_00